MFLTIVLRKEVADIPQAQTLTDIVRTRLEDHPDVAITASVSQPLELPEPPS